MIGWHYTSYINWLSIKKEGFIPYPINKPELDAYFPKQVKGIWTWQQRPTGASELGSILFQTSTKMSTHIVLLEFDYEKTDILSSEGRKINLYHDGHLGSWLYHKDQIANIVTVTIPPEKVRLIKDVNLMDLVPPDLGVQVGEEVNTNEHFG